MYSVSVFYNSTNQSPGMPETLATDYNPGMYHFRSQVMKGLEKKTGFLHNSSTGCEGFVGREKKTGDKSSIV